MVRNTFFPICFSFISFLPILSFKNASRSFFSSAFSSSFFGVLRWFCCFYLVDVVIVSKLSVYECVYMFVSILYTQSLFFFLSVLTTRIYYSVCVCLYVVQTRVHGLSFLFPGLVWSPFRRASQLPCLAWQVCFLVCFLAWVFTWNSFSFFILTFCCCWFGLSGIYGSGFSPNPVSQLEWLGFLLHFFSQRESPTTNNNAMVNHYFSLLPTEKTTCTLCTYIIIKITKKTLSSFKLPMSFKTLCHIIQDQLVIFVYSIIVPLQN